MEEKESKTVSMRRNLAKAYSDIDMLFKNCYCREEGMYLLQRCKQLIGRSGFVHRKQELVRNLNGAGISCSGDATVDELEAKVAQLPPSARIEGSLMELLFNIYSKFESPAEYIAGIVRRYADPLFANEKTRLAILKQFILYTDYCTGPVNELIREKVSAQKGIKLHRGKRDIKRIAEYVDDSVFDVLDKQLSKYEKGKYALLRLCDDIAAGNFRTNGRTKNSLYIFAMAFDLRWYPDSDSAEYDASRDFEKILFFDYYGNSVLRYISKEYNERNTDFEKEPTGEGINYKNFAEVIYLYYLSRTDLSPRERISRSQKMIEACVSRNYKEPEAAEKADFLQDEMTGRIPYTYAYKDFYIEKAGRLTEKDLVSFIIKYYSTGERDASASRVMIDSQTNTAAYYYAKYLRGKTSEYDEDRRHKNSSAVVGGYDAAFIKLISYMDSLLHMELTPDLKRISRMRIIAAVYDYCIREGIYEGKGLHDIYCEFSKLMNRILIDSRFQPISEKNIFDMYAIISLYYESNIL